MRALHSQVGKEGGPASKRVALRGGCIPIRSLNSFIGNVLHATRLLEAGGNLSVCICTCHPPRR